MRLEDQVVSLDTAKRLKELGVAHRSLFHWERLQNGKHYLQRDEYVGSFCEETYAAFTVAELGELLPEWCSSSRDHDGLWEAYPPALYNDIPPVRGQSSEAEARGLLLAEIMEKYPEYPDQYYQAVQLEEETHALV